MINDIRKDRKLVWEKFVLCQDILAQAISLKRHVASARCRRIWSCCDQTLVCVCKTRTSSEIFCPLLSSPSGSRCCRSLVAVLAWQLAFSQLALRRVLSLRSPWRSTSRTRSPSPTVSPMTLSSPRLICSQPRHASSVMGTSLLLGLSLFASCNVAPFPSTCSVSPIWCICLLNLWSAPPATLSPLLLWTSSTSSTCAVFVMWRLLQASA